MKYAWIGLLVLVLVGACGEEDATPYHRDVWDFSALPSTMQPAVRAGMRWWVAEEGAPLTEGPGGGRMRIGNTGTNLAHYNGNVPEIVFSATYVWAAASPSLICGVARHEFAHALGYTSHASHPVFSAPLHCTYAELLAGIRDIESSGGVNCGVSSAGARGCYQILPKTAAFLGCGEGWATDGWPAAECAARWLAYGEEVCRRGDDYALAHFYYTGACLARGAKPPGYAMDVVRAALRHRRA